MSDAHKVDLGHLFPGLVFTITGVLMYIQFCIQVALPKSKKPNGEIYKIYHFVLDSAQIHVNPFKHAFLTYFSVVGILVLAISQQAFGRINPMKNLQHFYMYVGVSLLCIADALVRRGLLPKSGLTLSWIMAASNTATLFSVHPPHWEMEAVLHNYIIYTLWVIVGLFIVAFMKPSVSIKGVISFWLTLLGSILIHTAILRNWFRDYTSEEAIHTEVMTIEMNISGYSMLLFAIYGMMYLVAYNVGKTKSKISGDGITAHFEAIPIVPEEESEV